MAGPTRLDMKAAIHNYVVDNCDPVPQNLAEVEAQVDTRIKFAIENCLTQAREHGANTPVTINKSRTISGSVTVSPKALDIFRDILTHEHGCTLTLAEAKPAAQGVKDSLLWGLERALPRPVAYTFKLNWRFDTRSIYGDNNPYDYPLLRHVSIEWQAALAGRGTDVTIRLKDAEPGTPELHAHKAKLIMHSPFFEKHFKESQDTSIVLEDCSLETFRALLCFIYTGVISWGTANNWKAIKDLYVAAKFYDVGAAKYKIILALNTLIVEKKMTDELAELLEWSLTHWNEYFIKLCFASFDNSEKIEKTLIAKVDEKNVEKLLQLASNYPSAKNSLQKCLKYNPNLANALSEKAKKSSEKSAEKDGKGEKDEGASNGAGSGSAQASAVAA